MGEMPSNIDPNFETMSRPRSGTWPMNRPDIAPRRNRMQGTLLDATLEEANSQELISEESGILMDQMPVKDDLLSLLSNDTMLTQSDFDGVLIGSSSSTANPVALPRSFIKSEPCNDSDLLQGYCSSATITELSNIGQDRSFEEGQVMGQQLPGNLQCQNTSSVTLSPASSTSLSKTTSSSTTVTGPQVTTSGATPKAKSTRKNAWGNMSYADLITQAIESSPEQRLTLAQVYEWMVKNVPYFKDKGDSNSSAGWKNSIRHNLSLHAKFKRIQNEGTGKSSWWVINHDAKPGKSPRRRAISMDNANAKYNRSRKQAIAKQKAEQIKKQKTGLKSGQSPQRDSGSWGTNTGLETPVSKALGLEYRSRTVSNASSLGGRMSPSRGMFLAQDLEDDGAPPVSPLSGSNGNLANFSTSLPSAFNTLFDVVRQDNTSIPENGPSVLHENLLDSLAISSPLPYSPESTLDPKDMAGMYLQSMNGCSQSSDMKNLSSSVAQNSPNLANLLQQKSNPLKKSLSNNPPKTMPTKMEPQGYEADSRKVPFPYSDYQSRQMMSQSAQSTVQYKTQMQQPVNEGKPLYHYSMPPQNMPSGPVYRQMPQVAPAQQPYNYITPQQSAMISTYLGDSQPQQQMGPMSEQQQEPQFQTQQSNLQQLSEANFPPDLNGLTNHELLDTGDIDMSEMLQDDYFSMEFDKGGNFFQNNCQMQQQSGDYGMGVNGGNSLVENLRQQQQQQQQQQQPMLHPNPDVFITSTQPGNPDMMLDGCRMNNSNFQRLQPNQTSAIGAAPSYGMQ